MLVVLVVDKRLVLVETTLYMVGMGCRACCFGC